MERFLEALQAAQAIASKRVSLIEEMPKDLHLRVLLESIGSGGQGKLSYLIKFTNIIFILITAGPFNCQNVHLAEDSLKRSQFELETLLLHLSPPQHKSTLITASNVQTKSRNTRNPRKC